jgi:Domain of unknown function (DUF5122) beta-propeller
MTPSLLKLPAARRLAAALFGALLLPAVGQTSGTMDALNAGLSGGLWGYCSIQLTNGDVLLGGDFERSTPDHGNLIALDSTGTAVLSSFDLRPDNSVSCLLQQADGKVLVGGSFTGVAPGGIAAGPGFKYLVRLHEDGTLDTSYAPQPQGVV